LHLAGKRASYSHEAVRALRYAFDKHLKAPAAALDRAAVVRVLDRITLDGKKAIAGRTGAYGSAFYHWAIKRGTLAVNPFADLPLTPVVKRERVLDDAELKAVWQATEGPGPFNAIVRMLILTGQRLGEVAGMAWAEISDDTWTIPASRAKNKAAHIVPLSSQAQAIVRAAPRFEGSNLVFPGLRGPFNSFSKAKKALDKASGAGDWRLHDLRRTVATGLQKIGVRLEVTEAVLNHVSGSRAGIVGVYQRHKYEPEKRQALDAWARKLKAIVTGAAASNVVKLTKARR
jgi:integrase